MRAETFSWYVLLINYILCNKVMLDHNITRKSLLSYNLKMASCEPKHCNWYVLLINYVLFNKVMLDHNITHKALLS